MNLFTRIRLLALLLFLMVAACQPGAQSQGELPTLMDTNVIATDDAATVTGQVQAVASSQPPTLPPTWTPSPESTQAPTVAPLPSATPVLGRGSLYYIFNDDSIVRLAADGSFEQLILVGGAPADLTLSPDGMLLAYVSQGNGSAREIFVSSPDGTYTQQVSCLGFSRALNPVWSPDGQTLAFAASQTINGPLGIYVAQFAGSNQCPAGNNQRLAAQTDRNNLSDLTWNETGTKVFFSSEAIYGVDVTNGVLYPPLSQPSGYGPDYGTRHDPRLPTLYYIKTVRDDRTGEIGGRIFQIDTQDITNPPLQELGGALNFAQSLHWSVDGSFLAFATNRDVWVQDQESHTSLQVVKDSNFYPQPVFSPNADFVAFVDGGFGARTIQQIYTVARDGSSLTQITAHQEGTITNLNWSAS